jgi:hypothetical protein
VRTLDCSSITTYLVAPSAGTFWIHGSDCNRSWDVLRSGNFLSGRQSQEPIRELSLAYAGG